MNAKSILNRLRHERKENNRVVTTTTTTTATASVATQAPSVISEVKSDVQEGSSRDMSDLEERIVFLDSISTSIRLLEDPHAKWSSGNGATLWDAALVLTSYLLQEVCGNHTDAVGDDENKNKKERKERKGQLTFIELGAGLGFPGLALYSQGHRVISTERPLTIDLLEANIRLNSTPAPAPSHVSTSSSECSEDKDACPVNVGSIQSFPLEWTESHNTTLLPEEEEGGGQESACAVLVPHSPLRERLRQTLAGRKETELGSGSGGRSNMGCSCSWDVVLGSDLIFPNNEECWPALAAVWDQLLTSPLSGSGSDSSCSGSGSSSRCRGSGSDIFSRTTQQQAAGTVTAVAAVSDGTMMESCSGDRPGRGGRPMSRADEDGAGTGAGVGAGAGDRGPRGYLSYEHRSAHVIDTFRELLRARDISCERCFSDHVAIPDDIHIYKLCKLTK